MALVQVIIDTENPDRPAELFYPYLYVGRNNIYYTDEARIIGCDYKSNPHTMSTPDLVALVEKLNFRQLGAAGKVEAGMPCDGAPLQHDQCGLHDALYELFTQDPGRASGSKSRLGRITEGITI